MPFDPNRMMAEQLRAWSALQRLAFRHWEAATLWSQLAVRAGQRWAQPDAAPAEPGEVAGEAMEILTRWQRGVFEIFTEQASAMQAMLNEIASLRPGLALPLPALMPGAALAAPAS